MSRRIVVTAVLPMPDPEPAYPEYEDVRREARRQGGPFVNLADVDRMQEVSHRRGYDWCVAVLGKDFPGVRRISIEDGWSLIVADQRDLNPPLPPRIVEERRLAEEHRTGQERAAEVSQTMAVRAWQQLAVQAPVKLTVHENTQHTGPSGRLRHVTAAVDLRSGRARLHKAGSALCETENRPKPLILGEAVDLPPTCKNCKKYVPLVRTLDAPAPPTPAERRLLQLIKSGVVFTLRPGRTNAPMIRDTSVRSTGVAWGHLGRKVDAAVKKLEDKGLVTVDAEHSKTQAGGMGWRWRLTDAGTAALES